MMNCPGRCGSMLADSAICCNLCGWQSASKKAQDGGRHPIHGYRLCENEQRGDRCGKAGIYSSNLHEGGPWYCFNHFPAFKNWARAQDSTVPPPMGFRALREIANKLREAA